MRVAYTFDGPRPVFITDLMRGPVWGWTTSCQIWASSLRKRPCIGTPSTSSPTQASLDLHKPSRGTPLAQHKPLDKWLRHRDLSLVQASTWGKKNARRSVSEACATLNFVPLRLSLLADARSRTFLAVVPLEVVRPFPYFFFVGNLAQLWDTVVHGHH